MENHILWITFVVAIHFSTISCRNPYFEYYYSRYHKGHSTTESISPTQEVSSEEDAESSASGDIGVRSTRTYFTTGYASLENRLHSSTGEHAGTENTKVDDILYGDSFYERDYQYYVSMNIGIVVGCFFVFLLVSCCIFCCLRNRFRGRERRGLILSNPHATVTEVRPQQPVISQQNLVAPQQYPPQYADEHTHLVPPPYQPQPLQQQYYPAQSQFQQAPAEQQPHNPPEAPPPYDFPNKF